MNRHIPAPRTALIYPPFGPFGLPNLGLANLSGGLKTKGFDCKTFYWNLAFAAELPLETPSRRFKLYQGLTRGMLFPFNEWIFSDFVFDKEQGSENDQMRRMLLGVDDQVDVGKKTKSLVPGLWPQNVVPSEVVLEMQRKAPELMDKMVAHLEGFDIIGINTTFYQNIPAIALAAEVKRRWPEKITVIGGANCDDVMGRALLEHFPALDVVFSGEVDHSFPDFVERIHKGEDWRGLAGIHFRKENGELVSGPPAEPIHEMDLLPYPDFDDYVEQVKTSGFDKFQKLVLALESSRGCWWGAKHHCTFCGLNANGMGYRKKSLERFKKEVRYMADRYNSRFFFMADNIMSMSFYNDFMDWAESEQLGIDFFYEIKANVNRKQVARLAKGGVTFVQPGIESFSSNVLQLMRKGVKGIQNVAFLKYAREYGVLSTYSILSRFPGESPEDYAEMARQLPKLVHFKPPNGVTAIEFHRFSPYYYEPEAFGIEIAPHPKYSWLYPFSDAEVARIAYQFIRIDEHETDYSYLEDVNREVQAWRSSFADDVCLLSWKAEEGAIVIHDRRPGFIEANYILRNFAIPVFFAMDSPVQIGQIHRRALKILEKIGESSTGHEFFGSLVPEKIKVLADGAGTAVSTREFLSDMVSFAMTKLPVKNEFILDFGADEFEADPAACLKPLLEGGILYEEGDALLALPVTDKRQKSELDWYGLTI